jgi:hypothetical protein
MVPVASAVVLVALARLRRTSMNRSRILGLVALIILVVALLASTALAGGKDAGKKWGAGAGLAFLQQ